MILDGWMGLQDYMSFLDVYSENLNLGWLRLQDYMAFFDVYTGFERLLVLWTTGLHEFLKRVW